MQRVRNRSSPRVWRRGLLKRQRPAGTRKLERELHSERENNFVLCGVLSSEVAEKDAIEEIARLYRVHEEVVRRLIDGRVLPLLRRAEEAGLEEAGAVRTALERAMGDDLDEAAIRSLVRGEHGWT